MEKNYRREIEILKGKREFKNYKDLCNHLGWEISAGNVKKKQMKELDLICRFSKNGNKFIIEEIYEDRADAEFKKACRVKYMDNLENIIMGYLLLKGDGRKCISSKSNFMKEVGLINANFNLCKEYQFKTAQLLGVDIRTVSEYFNLNTKSLKADLERAMKNLSKMKLIDYNMVTLLCKYEKLNDIDRYVFEENKDEKGNKISKTYITHDGVEKFTVATDEERDILLMAGREALEVLGFKDISEVYAKGQANLYYKIIEGFVRHKIQNYKFSYEGYDIIYREEIIKQELSRRGYPQWTDLDKENNILAINEGTAKKLEVNANKRKSKAEKEKNLSKKKINRIHDEYINETKTLNKTVIKKDSEDIKDILFSTKVEKETYDKYIKKLNGLSD